jgi:cell division protein FtsW (lipid II flippase)
MVQFLNYQFSKTQIFYFLLANVLVLGIVAYACVLESAYPDFYYLSIQEDEYLEWSSFWAFLLATVAYFRRAADYRQTTNKFPWFFYGITLFCFIVAMEEISWGQRLIGYRPPVYFLEHNFQQEFNFHNVVDTDYRKLALTLIIAGYGIGLPLAARLKFLDNWFKRIGIVTPSIALLPAYAGTFLLYVLYPWSHSGEWVELMLGLSFLFSAGPSKNTAIAFVAVIGLGLVSGAFSRAQRDAVPENIQAAKIEVDALSHDFENGFAHSRCNLHKRLYTFVQEYDQTGLLAGSYSGLQSQGLPQERAEYFLDPWNSPYWIRDRCDRQTNRRITFIYSFGPDRQRDSSRTEILGDDIGSIYLAK